MKQARAQARLSAFEARDGDEALGARGSNRSFGGQYSSENVFFCVFSCPCHCKDSVTYVPVLDLVLLYWSGPAVSVLKSLEPGSKPKPAFDREEDTTSQASASVTLEKTGIYSSTSSFDIWPQVESESDGSMSVDFSGRRRVSLTKRELDARSAARKAVEDMGASGTSAPSQPEPDFAAKAAGRKVCREAMFSTSRLSPEVL